MTDDLVAILYSRLNSPRYFSVYPPASQLAFAIGTWLGGGTLAGAWYGIKALFVACEAVGIACLARVVPARGVALYALHPIAIVEVAGQAHTEGALVGALGLMVWGLSRRSPWAGAAVAAAGWVKLYPFGLAVALGRQGRAWLYATIGGALLVLVLVPGGSLQSIVRSVALYGAKLDFYSAPFLSLKVVLHPVLGTSAGAVASTVMALGWVAVLGALLLQNDQTREGRLRVLALAVVAYALLSPMQHPWNCLGILFVIPLLQNKLWIFWLLSLSLPTYLRYVGPEWAYPGALAVGWGGAAWLWWRARTHAARTPSAVASDASSQV